MATLSHCRLCSHESPQVFLDLGDQPFANALQKAQNNEKRYPLALAFCENCALVQLTYSADPKELFSSYVWVTGTAAATREYAKHFARQVLSRAPEARFVVEAASNDGTFLREFQDAGLHVLGVDPAANIAEIARNSGVPTKTAFFGQEPAKLLVAEHGSADVVVARNVLPHVADPHDFLAGVKLMMAPDGIGVVEAHHALTIFEELHYDSIYHEHLCYFTVKTFEAMAAKCGLYAFDVFQSPISGGSLVFIVSQNPRPPSPALAEVRKIEKDSGVNDLAAWQRFAELCIEHRRNLLSILESEARQDRTVAGYGASARSSTMLNFCGIGVEHIQMIADQNPLKHGLLSPGGGIPILAPDKMVDASPETIIVLAWNFFDEIQTILRNELGFRGRIIRPLPFSPVVFPKMDGEKIER